MEKKYCVSTNPGRAYPIQSINRRRFLALVATFTAGAESGLEMVQPYRDVKLTPGNVRISQGKNSTSPGTWKDILINIIVGGRSTIPRVANPDTFS